MNKIATNEFRQKKIQTTMTFFLKNKEPDERIQPEDVSADEKI